MNDQQAREFVEMLAVPERTAPPPCPLCGGGHQLEARCVPAPSAVASLVDRATPSTVAFIGDFRDRLDPVAASHAA